jgi:hypothetical protein
MRFALVTLAILASLDQSQAGRTFGPGVCGPLDPAYVRTASETGGQPFPMGPADMVHMSQVLAETTRSDSVMLLWAGGSATDPTTFSVPVDPAITRVTFSATFDGTGGSAAVAAPDGAEVRQLAGAQDAVMSCARILSVDTPSAGAWRVTVKPSARFWLVVYGRSDFDVLSAEFVRLAGRPGHEGLFQLEGQPIAGRPATLRVRLTAPEPTAPAFTLFSTLGQPIRRVTLQHVDDDEFVGPVDLPDAAFRVGIVKSDATGAQVQRVHARTFRAERIEVLPGAAVTAAVGLEVALPFTIRNLGARGRFRVTALAGGELVERIEPGILEIAAGSEARVTVVLPAQTAADVGREIEVRVVASQEDSAEPHVNSGVQRVLLVKN